MMIDDTREKMSPSNDRSKSNEITTLKSILKNDYN